MPYIGRPLGETYLGKHDSADEALRDAGSRITVRGVASACCNAVAAGGTCIQQLSEGYYGYLHPLNGCKQFETYAVAACWAENAVRGR